jgi:release factor glutamine methyltransferase
MPCPIKRIWFRELKFDLFEDVYEPAEDTFLFAENLDVKETDSVLDMGTGCGILGIVSAKNAETVFAADLNPSAIRCAKSNSNLNDLGCKISFVQADLFSSFKSELSFDLILFNSPYLPSEKDEINSWIGKSWAGGVDGRLVIDRFIAQVPSFLKPTGRVLLMQSTLSSVEKTLKEFEKHHLVASIKTQKKLPFFETLVLVEAGQKSI